MLQINCKTPLGRIAKKVGVPKSTVQYRMRRLEKQGVIEGYYAKIDAAKIGIGYHTITLVRGKFGPNYPERIGKMLAQIPGIREVYFTLGENDFVVLSLSNDREDFMRKLEKMYNMKEIERTNTLVVMNVIKWDPRIFFEYPNQTKTNLSQHSNLLHVRNKLKKTMK
jgi:Lrp/AsnC family leucine-responsive transcriptional regulator